SLQLTGVTGPCTPTSTTTECMDAERNFVESDHNTSLLNDIRYKMPFPFIQAYLEFMQDDFKKKSDRAKLWIDDGRKVTPGALKVCNEQFERLGEYAADPVSHDIIHEYSTTRQPHYIDASCSRGDQVLPCLVELQVVVRNRPPVIMTHVDGWYYLCSGEDDPARTCQSKNRIIKMMFLTRPRRSREGSDCIQSLNVSRSCRCHWGLKDDSLASCEVEGHEALQQLFEAYVNPKVRPFLRCHPNVTLYWNDMLDYVHRDEKWLYMTNVDGWYYLCSGEDDPARMCQSKNRIIKMMFLTAMARPRYDNTKRTHWYGKIGAWAFTSKCQALRNSKNRKRGDDVVEPTTVTREVYRDYLVNKVIPAIRSLWPRQRSSVMWIQQDNARPHNNKLCAPPAQSPGMNVLDLGFFNAIQCLQHQTHTTSIEELVLAVHSAFSDLDMRILDETFMTLQKVMSMTRTLFVNGSLPPRLECYRDVAASIEAMEERIDYEQRVVNMIELFEADCTIQGYAHMSNVNAVCEMAQELAIEKVDEENVQHVL
ncbi:hypothetical protein AaE_011989, partial [Aphanomyces astaci]